uniref:Uncharacterized protein n=1 Tax=Rangifer tarandus platyrhynchus TaxID=3082113 RepID=A0ACB0EJX3_RANTA|nr:unnamed protein product [Rangifer tarandus platyrhynchus]
MRIMRSSRNLGQTGCSQSRGEPEVVYIGRDQMRSLRGTSAGLSWIFPQPGLAGSGSLPAIESTGVKWRGRAARPTFRSLPAAGSREASSRRGPGRVSTAPPSQSGLLLFQGTNRLSFLETAAAEQFESCAGLGRERNLKTSNAELMPAFLPFSATSYCRIESGWGWSEQTEKKQFHHGTKCLQNDGKASVQSPSGRWRGKGRLPADLAFEVSGQWFPPPLPPLSSTLYGKMEEGEGRGPISGLGKEGGGQAALAGPERPEDCRETPGWGGEEAAAESGHSSHEVRTHLVFAPALRDAQRRPQAEPALEERNRQSSAVELEPGHKHSLVAEEDCGGIRNAGAPAFSHSSLHCFFSHGFWLFVFRGNVARSAF